MAENSEPTLHIYISLCRTCPVHDLILEAGADPEETRSEILHGDRKSTTNAVGHSTSDSEWNTRSWRRENA